MTHATRPRGLAAGLTTTLLVALLLTVTSTGAAASARDPADPYVRLVLTALDTCHDQGASRTYQRMTACVGDLAAPDPHVPFQIDLWNVFRECLYLYYRQLDAMYPSGDFTDVNECLEDHGIDVGLP